MKGTSPIRPFLPTLSLLLLAALLLLAPPVLHAGLDEGYAAYLRGDYAAALEEFRPLAEQGDAGAMNNLGLMYETGRGVPQDMVRAYALYNLSAAADPSDENRARGNRDRLAETLTSAQLLKGQELTRTLAQPGNFTRALDGYGGKTVKRKKK